MSSDINVTTNDRFYNSITILNYSNTPLIRTPLLPQNSVLIREVSFGEREQYIHSQYLLPKNCVLSRGVSFLESVL